MASSALSLFYRPEKVSFLLLESSVKAIEEIPQLRACHYSTLGLTSIYGGENHPA